MNKSTMTIVAALAAGAAANAAVEFQAPSAAGADPAAWDRFEPLATGFADGATSLAVEVPGIDRETVRYIRFYSREDGWSETAYIPDVAERKAFVIIMR